MNLNNSTNSNNSTDRMPVLFVGHGSPMNAIEENEFVQVWKKLGESLAKPKAIICISAHWETRGTQVTALPDPPTIHDFGGFSRELYEVQYTAPGSPELAKEAIKIISGSTVLPDEKWGLDHGAWSFLKHMYPKANVPVIEMSLDYNKSPKQHYELAKELASFREKGILIVGSGNIVHNLRRVAWDKADEDEYGFDWALEANEIIKKLIIENRHQELINYQLLGKEVQMAVPTPDHYLPLLYALALKNGNEELSFFNDKAVMGSLTMTSLKIG
ncbi:MAG: 4,5-DOPA dioxygenase extradiol [Paludibacter sp.]|nr:4,5-DOPA dioxygenase extradiol [Paludibacter sp.]